MKTVLLVFGTRPEAIKLAPLVHALAAAPELVSRVCVTGQHRSMLDQVLRLFSIVPGECLLINARTAEMCKLTENAHRDVNIASANEFSLVCEDLDIDVRELIRLSNRHPRVQILRPGPDVGGHCIAVDPRFIVDSAPERARLIRTARPRSGE